MRTSISKKLLGALGGFARVGLLGLFVGPIVVAAAYRAIGLWIELDEQSLEKGSATGDG